MLGNHYTIDSHAVCRCVEYILHMRRSYCEVKHISWNSNENLANAYFIVLIHIHTTQLVAYTVAEGQYPYLLECTKFFGVPVSLELFYLIFPILQF